MKKYLIIKKRLNSLTILFCIFIFASNVNGASDLNKVQVSFEEKKSTSSVYNFSVVKLIYASRECLNKGNLECALKFAREAVDLDPAYAEAWKQLGRVLFLKGDYDEALSVLKTSMTLYPDDTEVKLWIIGSYIEQDKIKEAINFIRNNKKLIINIETKITSAILLRLFEQGRMAEMIDVIELLKKELIQSDYKQIVECIDGIIKGERESSKNRMLLLKISDNRLHPIISLAWYLLGMIDFKNEDYKTAIDDFKKSLEYKGDWVPALRELGWAYKRSGQLDKAIDVWLKGSLSNIKRADWLPWLIETRIELGQYDKAIEDVEQLLKIQPDNYEARAMKLSLFVLKNSDEEIKRFLSQIIKTSSSDYVVTKGYAFAYRLKGMFREAEKYLDNYMQKHPEDFRIRKMLIDTYADWAYKVPVKDALYPLQKLLVLEPYRKSAWRDLGWSFWANGKIDDAINAWEQSLKDGITGGDKLVFQIVARLIEDGHEQKAMELLNKWVPDISLYEAGYKFLSMDRLIPSRVLFLEAWNRAENSVMTGFYLAYVESHFGKCESVHEYILPFFRERLSFANEDEIQMLLKIFSVCSMNKRILSLTEELEFTVIKYPRLISTYNGLLGKIANELRISRDMETSWGFYKRLLNNNPNNKNAWFYAVTIGEELGFRNDVVALLNDVFSRTSLNIVKEGILGKLAEYNDDYVEAVVHYQKSIEEEPDQPDLRFVLFKNLMLLQRYDEAMVQYKWFADKVASGDNTVKAYYAEILSSLNKFTEVLPVWQELYLSFPGIPHYAVEYARALFLECKADEAIAVLEQFLKENTNQRAFELISEIYEALKKPDKVLYWTERALAYGEKASILRMRIDAAEAINRYDIVRDSADLIFKKERWNVKGATSKGYALIKNELYRDAEKYYKDLLNRNGQFLPALLYLRDIKSWGEDIDEAILYGKSIIKQRPWDVTNILRYSLLMAEDGNYKEAYRILRPFVEKPVTQVIPVLVYRNIKTCSYPGYNTLDQIIEHIERLSKEGYNFITPVELKKPLKWDAKYVIIVILNADYHAFIKINEVLKNVGGKAVLAYSALKGLSSLIENPSTLDELVLNDRWLIAWDGPFQNLYTLIDEVGNKGNLLTHRIFTKVGKEDLNSMENRLEKLFFNGVNLISNSKVKVFLYPEGDYGQFSLDTDSETIEVLHKTVGRYFDFAIFGDYYGFCVESFDPLRIPGKNVPNNWSGEELVNFLNRSNPLIMARLELAKIYSKQGQYERANKWFADAFLLGADPKEVNFHWGSNAYFEGDYPTSFEKLRYALKLDPKSEKILTSLRRTELKTRFNIQPFIKGWHDSDDRSYSSFGMVLEGYISDRLKIELFHEEDRWRREGLGKEEGREYGFGVLWHFKEEYWLRGQLWNMDLRRIDNHFGGMIDLHIPNPSFSGYLDIQFSREEIDTIEAVRKKIMGNNYIFFTYSRFKDFWDLFANLTYTKRSDDNATAMLNGRVVYRFKEWPFYGMGYMFRFADSDRKTLEYYAPKDLQQHQLYLTTRGEYKALKYSISFYSGYAKEYRTNWRFVWGGRFDIDFKIFSHLMFNGNYIYNESPVYSSSTWFLGLKYIF